MKKQQDLTKLHLAIMQACDNPHPRKIKRLANRVMHDCRRAALDGKAKKPITQADRSKTLRAARHIALGTS